MSKKKVADKPQGNKGARGWESRFRERDEASWSRGAKAAAARKGKSVKEAPAPEREEPIEKVPATATGSKPIPAKPKAEETQATAPAKTARPRRKKESTN